MKPLVSSDNQRSDLSTMCEKAVLELLAYCRRNDWAGYEPYDATNSRIFTFLPILNRRFPRLVLTQTLKRSPINIRRILGIEKAQNPKALAVFISALFNLSKIGLVDSSDLIQMMINRLIALRSPDISYWSWGYSFSWQTRSVFVPKWAPNIVCTTFVANALLDAYEEYQDPRCLSMAVSAADYIVNELYWTEGDDIASFSYPVPRARSRTHNANFLAAALLCRLTKLTGERRFLSPALAAARSSAKRQQADGSWNYGEAAAQHWIDNFHTGYNLCALRSIGRYAETTEFDPRIERGLEFYHSHFFRKDGAVRYYHNKTYPIDAHCISQAIITLVTFRDLDSGNVPLAETVFRWAMRHMWDDRGFFYFRVLRLFKNRIPYMRWTQAWMLLAMSMLLASPESGLRSSASVDRLPQENALSR